MNDPAPLDHPWLFAVDPALVALWAVLLLISLGAAVVVAAVVADLPGLRRAVRTRLAALRVPRLERTSRRSRVTDDDARAFLEYASVEREIDACAAWLASLGITSRAADLEAIREENGRALSGGWNAPNPPTRFDPCALP